MSTSSSSSGPDKETNALMTGDWRRIHAFGWPAGSVRALMAILVFVCIWVVLVIRPNREVPDYLRDVLFIILGHYFAVRGHSRPADEPGPPPLYLPRGSVRLVLVGGFLVTAGLLYRRGILVDPARNPAVVTLLMALGFVLGVILHQAWIRIAGKERALPRALEDLRALVSLAAAVFLAVLIWDQLTPGAPHWGLDRIDLGLGSVRLPQIAAALVGFYFGSRS